MRDPFLTLDHITEIIYFNMFVKRVVYVPFLHAILRET